MMTSKAFLKPTISMERCGLMVERPTRQYTGTKIQFFPSIVEPQTLFVNLTTMLLLCKLVGC